MEHIDQVKQMPPGRADAKYRLKNATVFTSSQGFHYIDYLDPVEQIPEEIDASKLTDEEAAYIERSLQSNAQRFAGQADLVKKFIDPSEAKVLDIGCGGGLFLSILKEQGADVLGIELSDSRAQYAKTKHGLPVSKLAIENEFWRNNYDEHFDVVTLWDVIEHVNFPFQTLSSAAKVLKPGGLLLIDTPCRDAFYHRFGALTYRLTAGRYPTFLNAMYSSHQFGHKQIFSTAEMRALYESCGFEVLELRKIHELSFPYEFYLNKLMPSQRLVRLMLPIVGLFFAVFKIKNKMVVVGRKT